MASERIEKLLAMQQKAEAQKRKAEQQLRAAKHKISIQRNKERTHRLCERGGHLEHYLPNPELLTDEDVFLLIDYFFSSPRVRELAEQITASRRGEIMQSPKELIDAARQHMPKPSVPSVTWHDADEDDAESDGSSSIPGGRTYTHLRCAVRSPKAPAGCSMPSASIGASPCSDCIGYPMTAPCAKKQR